MLRRVSGVMRPLAASTRTTSGGLTALSQTPTSTGAAGVPPRSSPAKAPAPGCGNACAAPAAVARYTCTNPPLSARNQPPRPSAAGCHARGDTSLPPATTCRCPMDGQVQATTRVL